MKKYFSIVIIGLKKVLYYPNELIFGFLHRFALMGFISLFWSIFLQESEKKLTSKEVISYFLITQSIAWLLMVTSQKYGSALRKLIQSGEISERMLKPVNVKFLIYFSAIGERPLSNIISVAALILGLIINPPVSVLSLVSFLLFLVMAGVIAYAFNLFEGVVTFYITEPSGIMNMFSHIARLLSGYWIPLMFFPEWVKSLAEYSPFPWMVHGPYQALYLEVSDPQLLKNFLLTLFWAIFLNVVMAYFWKKSIKTYEAIGI